MNQQSLHDQVESIREVFRYAEAYRGRTFVIQLDDAVSTGPGGPVLVKDLVLLWRAGIRIVLVTGARNRIDEVLYRYGISSPKHRGVRISTSEAIPFIRMAAFDVANQVMTSLAGLGVDAVIGNWVRARSLGVVAGVDYEDAGTVDKVNTGQITRLIDHGTMPLLPCIGWSASGKPYNLSSRELAAQISMALGAAKVFFVTEAPGLNSADYQIDPTMEITPGGRISRMNVDQADAFLDANRARQDAVGYELVLLARRAAGGAVERVHILDGRTDGVILKELFSTAGVGTMIHANQYQSIRPMRPDDVSDVYRLMKPLIDAGILVERSKANLMEHYGDYVLYDTDGLVRGCGALHRFGNAAEIAGIAVDERVAHLGIGRRIVEYFIEVARAEKLQWLFVLTTQASDWFEQLGFVAAPVEELPPERRRRYDPLRKSRVLMLTLE